MRRIIEGANGRVIEVYTVPPNAPIFRYAAEIARRHETNAKQYSYRVQGDSFENTASTAELLTTFATMSGEFDDKQ
ncbi:hypothetical protein E4K66_25480 [Bradyrhizobium frederickii]|uniref:Uncharacterized protein n=1 Tax=Bradyrhizobium frederickii TaxID=2560054 RepID=A0A4Y9L0V7_9BRAD|nr:hypothetical protein [Bradyrhizobium frederickii]TFV35673.1 hypothetical protein E4K66_25480 [Bradyrhizobium frederickii]